MSQLSITCNISGKECGVTKNVFDKRVQKFGSEKDLRAYYICRDAKTLLSSGKTISEARKELNSTLTNKLSDQDEHRILKLNNVKKKNPQTKKRNKDESATHGSKLNLVKRDNGQQKLNELIPGTYFEFVGLSSEYKNMRILYVSPCSVLVSGLSNSSGTFKRVQHTVAGSSQVIRLYEVDENGKDMPIVNPDVVRQTNLTKTEKKVKNSVD